MPSVYATQEDCTSELGRRMQAFRADRPSEWLMDDFIRDADSMEEKISRLEQALKSIIELPSVRQDECCCIAMAAMDADT